MSKNRKIELVSVIGVLLCLFALMMLFNFQSNEWFDEYVFARLSANLPSYSTSGDWINQIPSIVWYADVGQDVYNLTYNAPIYLHMPLAPAIAYPLVKLTSDIHFLRILPICLSLGSMLLVYLITRRKVGLHAGLGLVPIVFSNVLLNGAMWFYWDTFMVFFFLLTLYIIEINPKSKWQYVVACCLVWTKFLFGIVFLIPLAIKNWKISLCALSIVPFYIITVIGTGDKTYMFTHYWNLVSFYKMNYSQNMLPYFWQIINAWGIIPYVILTGAILLFIKKYPTIVAFYILSIGYGFSLGLGVYQAAIMLYSGALTFPLVVYNIVDYQKGGKRLIEVIS